MTKKDYELIASVISEELDYWRKCKQAKLDLGANKAPDETQAIYTLQGLIPPLARALEKHDSRFKRFQFFRDCGFEIKQ